MSLLESVQYDSHFRASTSDANSFNLSNPQCHLCVSNLFKVADPKNAFLDTIIKDLKQIDFASLAYKFYTSLSVESQFETNVGLTRGLNHVYSKIN